MSVAGGGEKRLVKTALEVFGHQRVLSEVNEGLVSKRLGTSQPSLVPYRAYDASDASLMIAAGNDVLFGKLAHCLGHPEWAKDPRFATNRARLQHRDAIDTEIAAVIRTAPRAHWVDLLEGLRIPVAAVHSIAEAAADPQVMAMDMLRPVPGSSDADDGSGVLCGLPLSVDGVRPAVTAWAPQLGQDEARCFGKDQADD